MTSQLAFSGNPPTPKEALSQYDTPRRLASHMAGIAGARPGVRVLEPSAGLGSLADAAAARGASVTCVEIDADRVEFLRGSGYPTHHGDFLNTVRNADDDDRDVALMNPPCDGGQDLDHVLHALLFAPRVVALLPLGFLDGIERYERVWSKHTLIGLEVLVRRFKAAGTEMAGQRPFAIFDIIRGLHSRPARIGWFA